jgi:sugar/nucleoside kinase (ribokinase family)
MSRQPPRLLFVGRLHPDDVIGPKGDVYLDQPGGEAAYAAVGARVWSDEPLAILSRVTEDFPHAWLRDFESFGIDCQGVHAVSGLPPSRNFYEYRESGEVNNREPRLAFARRGLTLPRTLVDFAPLDLGEQVTDRYMPLAIRPEDLSPAHRQTRAAYLAPGHLATHATLPALLRSSGVTTIALSPSAHYWIPTEMKRVAPLIGGISLLLIGEHHARALFRESTRDLAEVARRLASYGWPVVIIHTDQGGEVIFQADKKSLVLVPPYPADIRNPVGALGAFAGGYLVGWRRAFDPLEAALYGMVSASLSVEGPGALFAMTRMKGLAEARLEWVRIKMKA